ncbi:N-6 DNA methylase [Escherichia coli]|nr:N-6 DNA methylase [Escherichia coli]
MKLGNTLSNDQLPAEKFDYMLSNPPFGVDWKKIECDINDEHKLQGADGRFGPGLPPRLRRFVAVSAAPDQQNARCQKRWWADRHHS